jgi:nuclear transport factor 2 (NTF2) superfamily protein
MTLTTSPIKPPFTEASARAKVQAAEDAWNTRNPEVVAHAYSEDSNWRNRNMSANDIPISADERQIRRAK